jgi:hypothetical protein
VGRLGDALFGDDWLRDGVEPWRDGLSEFFEALNCTSRAGPHFKDANPGIEFFQSGPVPPECPGGPERCDECVIMWFVCS